MTHRCHWPGCPEEVDPKLWGCKRHWLALPMQIRHAIWRAYRPGQEIDKLPSVEYMRAATDAQTWIDEVGSRVRLNPKRSAAASPRVVAISGLPPSKPPGKTSAD